MFHMFNNVRLLSMDAVRGQYMCVAMLAASRVIEQPGPAFMCVEKCLTRERRKTGGGDKRRSPRGVLWGHLGGGGGLRTATCTQSVMQQLHGGWERGAGGERREIQAFTESRGVSKQALHRLEALYCH